jgi:hypothetical protein
MMNLINLNGNPEDKSPLKKGQEYLGFTGSTVIMQVTGGTGTYHHNNNDEAYYDNHNNLKPNNIVFKLQNKEIIRINPEGFFWKGKLIAEDKEIYLKFKEFLEKTNE